VLPPSEWKYIVNVLSKEIVQVGKKARHMNMIQHFYSDFM